MNLILLSGESINNKSWIEDVEKTLRDLFGTTEILHYDHWKTGREIIDLETEFHKLPDLVKNMGDYIVFAKSIGAVLTLRGIYEKVLTIQKCIFVGPAFLVGEENIPNFKNWIHNFSINSIILCKTADPVAPAEPIRELLQRHNVQNYTFVEIAGDNHKYEDLEKIRNLVQGAINGPGI